MKELFFSEIELVTVTYLQVKLSGGENIKVDIRFRWCLFDTKVKITIF